MDSKMREELAVMTAGLVELKGTTESLLELSSKLLSSGREDVRSILGLAALSSQVTMLFETLSSLCVDVDHLTEEMAGLKGRLAKREEGGV